MAAFYGSDLITIGSMGDDLCCIVLPTETVPETKTYALYAAAAEMPNLEGIRLLFLGGLGMASS